MTRPKSRWGMALFLLSVPFVAVAFYLAFALPPSTNPKLHRDIIPILGIVFSALCFLAGHFSYPRVHNLKVYLAGYLTGLSGLAYFALCTRPVRHEAQIGALLILVFLNVVLVLLLPSYVKYRLTRRITYAITLIEAAWLVAAAVEPGLVVWAKGLAPDDIMGGRAWIGIAWALVTFVLTVRLLRDEFHLGGLITAVALLYCLAWLGPAIVTPAHSGALQGILFAAAPLYLDIGIIVHWFMRMEHRVSYDPLLHIYNRNYCSRIITEQSSCNTSPPFGVAMVDIDHFKKVNDTHGHQAGDAVLYAVAQTIVRESLPSGIVCRYGGEEIVVFFPKSTAKDIAPIMEKVRRSVEKATVVARKKKLSVTVSCGISHRADTSQSIIDVINAADKALYRAKKDGRNQIKSAKTPTKK